MNDPRLNDLLNDIAYVADHYDGNVAGPDDLTKLETALEQLASRARRLADDWEHGA